MTCLSKLIELDMSPQAHLSSRRMRNEARQGLGNYIRQLSTETPYAL